MIIKRMPFVTLAVFCCGLTVFPLLTTARAEKGGKAGGGGGEEPTAVTTTYQLTILGTPPGIAQPRISDMNNHGDLVGWGVDPSQEFGPAYYRAVFYKAAQNDFVDINNLPAMDAWPGWTAALADSINDAGQIAVLMIDGDGTKADFLYEPLAETLTMLDVVGDLYGDTNYLAINIWGDVAYNKYDANGLPHWQVYSYNTGASVDLGFIGTPIDINSSGEVLGTVEGGGLLRYSTVTGEQLSTEAVDMTGRLNDSGDMCLKVPAGRRKTELARYVEGAGLESVSQTGTLFGINAQSDVGYSANASIFISTYDLDTVSVKVTGSTEDLLIWNSIYSLGDLRMNDRDQISGGLGQIGGSAMIDSSGATRLVYTLTPVPATP